jgi:hypothetical protein
MFLNNSIKGFYTVEKLNAQKEITKSFSFGNLITSYGLSFLSTETPGTTKDKGFYYCSIGDGFKIPETTDTTLQNQKGIQQYTSVPEVEVTSSYGYVKWTYEWAEGTLDDVNVTEVGVGRLDTGGDLISRSLIKDNNGHYGTLNIQRNETLRITYELKIYLFRTTSRDISFVFNGEEIPGEIEASLDTYSDTGLDAVNHVLGSDKGLCYGEDICGEINRTDKTGNSFSIERIKNDDDSYTISFILPVYNAPDSITKINFYSQTYPYGFILNFPEPITIKDNEELKLVIKKSLRTF